jgi:Rrf2 family protein
MLSQKAKYALRAVMMLAERAGEADPVRVPEIAQRERISLKFLEAILVELRDAGLVESRRGRNGGYRLKRAPEEISFGDVIRIVDGPLAPIRCASRTQFEPCADCPDVASCVIRWAMVRARDAISNALDHCSLAEALSQQIKLPPDLAAHISGATETPIVEKTLIAAPGP